MTVSSPRTLRRLSKVEVACAHLHDMAMALGPGAKLPTIGELKGSLGVSITTLNTALETLEEKNIVQRQNGVGIYVSSRLRKHNIYLICDPGLFRASDASPFWQILLNQVERRAYEEDENLSLHFSTLRVGNEVHLDSGIMQQIRNRHMDGVMVVGLSDETTRWIAEQGVHVVGYASKAPHRVRGDNRLLVKQGIDALTQASCKRIGYWSSISPGRMEDVVIAQNQEFRDPFVEELKAHRNEVLDDLIETGLELVDERTQTVNISRREQGYRIASRVFSQPRSSWPDGILISDDGMALGALIAFSRLGVVPGRDVRIVSHANIGSTTLHGYEEEIAYVAFDPAKIVRQMFHLMEQLLNGQPLPEQIVYVPPEKTEFGQAWNSSASIF